jgi:transglutaminase-like putative cysteine protease
VRRTLAASALPALAIAIAWLRTEEPPALTSAALVAALATACALPGLGWARALALACASAGLAAAVAGVRPSAVLEREDVLEPVVRVLSTGIGDFYGVVLPFDPGRHEDMHAVVLLAVFGFTAAVTQLVAARRPLGAAAVTIVAVGWPATLTGAETVLLGALSLAAALSVFVALGVSSLRGVAVSAVAGTLVVTTAASLSAATTLPERPTLDWRAWDFRGVPAAALGVRFVWNANYDGISFPPTRTTVLEIEGPEEAQYWRVSTLELFTADHWFEDHYPQGIAPEDGELPLDALMPPDARDRSRWLEQRVSVKALVDDRIAAAGTPVAISTGSLGTVFRLTGGVIRARHAIRGGSRYRVWSYVPDPTPSELAAAGTAYPSATRRFLEVWGQAIQPFGAPNRSSALESPLFGVSRYLPLLRVAERVTRGAETPYEAVLALESWFRTRGGFRYDERPVRRTELPPLVEFVTVSKAGYCQHYAGAMAVMLRLLGVPARVAVGFTSGRRVGGVWHVTDHDAHAWVEVWFPGVGWVAFDPTPGRGTLSGVYSFASENAQAVAALGRGDLAAAEESGGRGVTTRRGGGEIASQRDARPTLPGALALALVLSLASVGTGKWAVRRARYLSREPRALATASRRELEGFLRDQGVALRPGATLEDLAAAAARELGVDGAPYVKAAGRARFGPPEGARWSAHAARRELRALLDEARRALSPWSRLRGFVSLRSLVGGRGT